MSFDLFNTNEANEAYETNEAHRQSFDRQIQDDNSLVVVMM